MVFNVFFFSLTNEKRCEVILFAEFVQKAAPHDNIYTYSIYILKY